MIKESIILFMAEKSTLFFNFGALERETKCNPLKMVSLLKDYRNKRILVPGLKRKLAGNSYLLAPDALFNDRSTDILYIYQYISLAAKRDYTLYTLYGIKSLVLSYYPELQGSDSINFNPLLVTTKTEIHFKYEEIYYGFTV